jgi:hypothetical protein
LEFLKEWEIKVAIIKINQKMKKNDWILVSTPTKTCPPPPLDKNYVHKKNLT